MSVLTKVERKGWKGRLFLAAVTLSLVIGGTTMIYPFLLMLSGSLCSQMDVSQMSMVPKYLYDDTMLARKFFEYKYNGDVADMNRYKCSLDYSFAQAFVFDPFVPRCVDDLKLFADKTMIPDHWWVLGGTQMRNRMTGPNKRRFTQRVKELYNNDLGAFSEDVGYVVANWRDVDFQMPFWDSRRYDYEPSRYYQAYQELSHQRPLAEHAFVSITGLFLETIIYPEYGRVTVDAYNAAHCNDITSFQQIILSRRIPPESQAKEREEWITFVRELLNTSFVRTTVEASRWREYLRSSYGTIASLNRTWSSSHADFEAIDLPGERQWLSGVTRVDYRLFLETLPLESLYLVGPEFAWQDWLQEKYGSLDALNQAHHTQHTNWSSPRIPMDQLEYAHVLANTRAMRWQYATSNFRDVFNEVLVQGRPFMNTMIFVVLSLVLTLTLQPLAAYSLSRFHPPGSWRIILILMATMAFPPMVGMIPQFLILRKLHLLNTFIALVLPVIVNGYMIFLLKGFFDSLPHHLYEAALIDGASELRIFWEITMALSKPILAVMALQTFNMAWMSFMGPLLVCPDESMHMLAVWLYQFQQQAPTSAVFAAILITSIPTLLLFVFAQRTIMRGIAVPAEK